MRLSTLKKIRIKAESDAEAIRIKADAEAEANAKIAASLTKELIDKQRIDKWNGELPVITSDSVPIVDIGEITNGQNE